MLINNLAFHNGAACWGTARGYFSLHGTRLHFLSQEMKTSAELARALDMMPEHLHMFRSMQKSVGVPVHLKTLSDVARYMRKFSADPKLWDELKGLWCEAMEIYVEKLTMTHYESVKGLPQYPIVERILKLTEDVERKPLKLELRLSYVDGQISLKRALAAAVSWLFRKANRDAALWVDTGLMKGASVDVETVKVNEKKTLYKEHIERTAILSLLKIYITSCGADVGFRLHSGGEINIAMRRGEATLPVTYLASSPLNPFSSGFSDVGGYMLGVFHPTETEELSVTTPDQGVADIKVCPVVIILSDTMLFRCTVSYCIIVSIIRLNLLRRVRERPLWSPRAARVLARYISYVYNVKLSFSLCLYLFIMLCICN